MGHNEFKINLKMVIEATAEKLRTPTAPLQYKCIQITPLV